MFNTDILQQFHFLRPAWLLALPLLAYVFYYLKDELSQDANWRSLLAVHLRQHLSLPAQDKKRMSPFNLAIFFAVLGSVALSGPTWQRQSSPLVEDEALLVIAIDMSFSMSQQDVQPSRLERAKQKVADLLEKRVASRTGLIVFAGSAHVLVPVTNDVDVLKHFLAAARPEMMPVEGKFTEKTLALVAGMFAETANAGVQVPGTMLLITDGVSPKAAARLSNFFADSAHQLLVLGVGQEYSELSVSDTRDSEDSDLGGKRFSSVKGLQKQSLADLANDSGGSYQTVTLDKSDIAALAWRIKNHFLNVDDESRPWVDKGYYLLYPMVLLLIFWFREGWTIVPVLLCAVIIAAGSSTGATAADAYQPPAGTSEVVESTQPVVRLTADRFFELWLSKDQMGRRYFERGEFSVAASYFKNLHWRAVAYYHAEDFGLAAHTFAALPTSEALFNQANAWAQGQYYVKALEVYDQLLSHQPDHQSAMNNRKIVQELIDEINAMSESQQKEAGVSSQDLGEEPQRVEGAEKEQWRAKEREQYDAEQILTERKIQELWMKQVQQDPSRFLSVKFQMQIAKSRDRDASD